MSHEICTPSKDEAFLSQAGINADVLYEQGKRAYSSRIDKLFIALFCVQWPAAIALAFFMTPTTWAGSRVRRICTFIWR